MFKLEQILLVIYQKKMKRIHIKKKNSRFQAIQNQWLKVEILQIQAKPKKKHTKLQILAQIKGKLIPQINKRTNFENKNDY